MLSGCSLRVQNLNPPAPFDFQQIAQAAGYAQAAYKDDAAIRALCQPAFHEVHIQTILSTQNKYFLASSSSTRTQLISIAGTTNLDNVLLDADITQTFVPELQISLHRGFSKAARLIYDDAKPRLRAGYRLLITGHSLGGAEAVILAKLLKAAGMPAERVITFGQPKVSNQAGAEAFKDLPLVRVVNQNDLVPEMPLAPYSHIGPVVVLFPGTDYSFVQERPLDPKALIAAWEALKKHQSPAELPHHYIVNYLANLDSKLSASRLIAYPKSE
jgi:hypothetical protein